MDNAVYSVSFLQGQDSREVEVIVTKLSKLLSLLRNRNFLLVMALALGFLLGERARWTEPLSLPALAAAMAVSLTGIVASDFRSWRKVAHATALSIVLTYLVQGALTLLLSRLLISEPELWVGFVLLATTPSGIAVIPFSYVLGGDTVFALVGSIAVYLAALVIMPVMAVLLLGSALIPPMRLVTVLVQLVLIPLIASRLLNLSLLKAPIERWRGTIVNWVFALVIFTVIGLNRDGLLQRPQMLLLIGLIGLSGSFGLGFVLEGVLRKLHFNRALRLTSVLMGTIKNTSLTAAIALSLFSEQVSLPAAVVSAINVLYLVWLGVWWGEKDGKTENGKA